MCIMIAMSCTCVMRIMEYRYIYVIGSYVIQVYGYIMRAVLYPYTLSNES